ncbi:MAG: cytochrome P450 [bacterium]|nr:cytochrome P450 [bacterium]
MPELPKTLFDPEIIRDPFSTLAILREHAPVFHDEAVGLFVLSRHDDVKALFAEEHLLSRDRRLAPDFVPPPPGSWAERMDEQGTGRAEGEDHRAWRARLSKGFTPRAVARQEAQVREVVAKFGDPLRGRKGVVDLVDAFTNPIPNTVISRIVGIPPYPDEEDRFRQLAQDVIRRFFPMADEENIRRGEAAFDELAEWVGKLAEERREQAAEDFVSDLIHGNPDDPMTDEEIVIIVAILIAAGSETTTLGGTNALKLLLRHPHQLELLREDPGLARAAVRESLRFDFGTIAGSPRFAMEDFELHGVAIPKGSVVMLSSAAANRDPRVFDDPDRFDITRDNREMLTFGSGPHYCLGANLALQEMACMLDAATSFLPETARLLDDEIEWESVGIIRRPSTLPVHFG